MSKEIFRFKRWGSKFNVHKKLSRQICNNYYNLMQYHSLVSNLPNWIR